MSKSDLDATPYDMDEIAENHASDNYTYDTDHSAHTLSASLFTASEILGHNNKSLREAVGVAQQLVGVTQDLSNELRPFEVDDSAIQHGTAYLQQLKNTSKVCLAQSKQMKSKDTDTFKHIDRLINTVTADDYSKMVF